MANVVGSACVYNSCDQSSAPVLLLLCSSPPPPSVCTYCSLPGKGALKASTSERMAGPMWFCGNTRSKSVNQNFDKITLNFSLSSTLLPSLSPSLSLSMVSPCSTGCLGIFCVLHWTQTCHLPVSPSQSTGITGMCRYTWLTL